MTPNPPPRRGLGRGLDALLGRSMPYTAPETSTEPGTQAPLPRAPGQIPVAHIRPSRIQPRRLFSDEELAGLAASIREKGVLQPVLVRPVPGEDNAYELIAGERRWRAAQAAQLHEIPAIIRELTDGEALEVALIENLQRQDLTPIEEAEGYQRLIQEFSHTQEALADRLGRSRSHVTNMLRLLTLPATVRQAVQAGQLTMGHARALVGCEGAEAIADAIRARKLSVRDTESLVQRFKQRGWAALGATKDGAGAPPARSPDIEALERDLGLKLGMAVHLKTKGTGGELTIRYRSLEQLDDLILRLAGRGTPS
jgi:ParB family transcriptional regulator, chromosome partitioning protein